MKKYQFNSIFLLIIFALSIYLQTAYANSVGKKNIVVTIKPLEGLVRAIAKDTVNIQRLLPDYASPHNYHFRPSDIRKIKSAHLVFRIDEDFERFITPLLQTLNHSSMMISLADLSQIKLLAFSKENKDMDNEHYQHKNNHHHAHQHGDQDLHIWMSPHNGMVMAEKIANELAQLNPQQHSFYQQNLIDLNKKIQQFADSFYLQAQQLQDEPYLVFHDSWSYFANTFHLHKLATINLHADIQPGVKTIINTRKKIKQYHARCLFSEPQFRPKSIAILTEGFTIKTTELDTLGSHLKNNANMYVELLRYTAQQIKNCLKSEG
jgi:zinc transport system substrate-binding protein